MVYRTLCDERSHGHEPASRGWRMHFCRNASVVRAAEIEGREVRIINMRLTRPLLAAIAADVRVRPGSAIKPDDRIARHLDALNEKLDEEPPAVADAKTPPGCPSGA